MSLSGRTQDRNRVPTPTWQAEVGKFLYRLSWAVLILNAIAGPILRHEYGWGDDAPDWVNTRMFLAWPFAGYLLGYVLGQHRR